MFIPIHNFPDEPSQSWVFHKGTIVRIFVGIYKHFLLNRIGWQTRAADSFV